MLVTPRAMIKAELRPDDLVEVDLGGSRTRGCREATTELDLHLRVYRRREDCGAVVHAHPPTATGFAVAGQGLPGDVLPEIALLMVRYRGSPTPRQGHRRWAMPSSLSWAGTSRSSWPTMAR